MTAAAEQGQLFALPEQIGFAIGEQVWVWTESHGWRVGKILQADVPRLAASADGVEVHYLMAFPLSRPVWVKATRCHPLRQKAVTA